MSEEIKPVVNEETADVAKQEQEVNFAEKTLAELSGLFQSLSESEDRMKRSKEAEAIKSAFYKRLSKEKAEAGEDAVVDEPDENTPAEQSTTRNWTPSGRRTWPGSRPSSRSSRPWWRSPET